jgi:hypothetical protein
LTRKPTEKGKGKEQKQECRNENTERQFVKIPACYRVEILGSVVSVKKSAPYNEHNQTNKYPIKQHNFFKKPALNAPIIAHFFQIDTVVANDVKYKMQQKHDKGQLNEATMPQQGLFGEQVGVEFLESVHAL